MTLQEISFQAARSSFGPLKNERCGKHGFVVVMMECLDGVRVREYLFLINLYFFYAIAFHGIKTID